MNNGDVGGSRGRGRGWQNPDNKPRELRRPKSVADDTKEAPVSNLSADAKEWYPPNYVPQMPVTYNQEQYVRVPRFSVQDRIRQAQDQDPYNFEDMSYSLDESENMDLRENIANLITVMCEITFDPGKFDTLCGPLVDSFVLTLNDTNYTRHLVEAIVNQSIGEANFRYNGARLCSIFDSVAPPEESTFRVCLLERCSAEEHKIISGLETSEENMRGFAMFLAEIYTQLENSQGGRIRSLGESLCKVLLHLLDTDKETNIKSVCQLLKLSGIALDADCPASMHAAFERLKRRAEMPCVRRVVALRAARWGTADAEPEPPARQQLNARRLPLDADCPASMHAAFERLKRRAEMPCVRRVVALRAARWGTADAEPEPPARQQLNARRLQPNCDPEGGMGGYLADGQALTLEERDFLQSNLPAKPAALEIDIMEELENEAWDTGMDAEMQAGYLEFLKISNQIKR